ncbi:hypothetical protein A3A71_00865 [Candidatus Berkelbacteria bacterium RIFCSPLOWO2_01_FULL_50_28]|uniref:Transcription regulator TrmB N-terminal domain-containing protein n=1 Tax=Candidatus Berkelbacteria bacterium RIFCSPLOWO2_01_FULL_50_28 TaxID=1797471 RepID=A0A1F5EB51_9BACT|nr:MAG: hypothetical protein A2807_01435 [Candidatus Berkelbacteria bacterium RIFCSPHIGHO2_01_FULL_50_36]OGD62102.1 MAG: hypothetical protein A3F39_03090 [Candidatus Berkelbacteria bacterium RIFCSPHIGHO2_12_FULL_50_11]OGD64593.1 MAG: hypothetical protein A3A71_00865 [Candidatus Berkelbacteria bacterium RIFCSPLOWO2_01_FULL_50_28]
MRYKKTDGKKVNIQIGMEEMLTSAGLSEKESRVYLAALELGESSVQNIATKSGINRPTAYFILGELSKKGLASHRELGKKTLYSAESPENLKKLLETQKQRLAQDEERIGTVIPQLAALFRMSKNRPVIRIYEGLEGQKTMRTSASTDPDMEIFSFTALDELKDAFPNYGEVHEKPREERGTKSNVIYTHRDGRVQENENNPLRISRYIPRDRFPFTGSITVHPKAGKVYISIYKKNLLAAVIESKDVADMLMAIWRLAWDAAEKYNVTKGENGN